MVALIFMGSPCLCRNLTEPVQPRTLFLLFRTMPSSCWLCGAKADLHRVTEYNVADWKTHVDGLIACGAVADPMKRKRAPGEFKPGHRLCSAHIPAASARRIAEENAMYDRPLKKQAVTDPTDPQWPMPALSRRNLQAVVSSGGFHRVL